MENHIINRLLSNEIIKLYKNKLLKLSIFLIFCIVLINFSVVFSDSSQSKNEWKAELKEQILTLKAQQLNIEVPEEYKRNFLTNEIKLKSYMYNNNIAPYSEKSVGGFVKKNAFLSTLISFVVIISASTIVSNEYRWGTINTLFIKPIQKKYYCISKFLSIVILTLSFYSFLFILSYLLGLFFFPNDFAHYVYISNGSIKSTSLYFNLLQLYGCKMISTILVSSFAFMLSCIFNNGTIATSAALISQFAGSILGDMASQSSFKFSKYIFFENLNWYQYVEGYLHSDSSFIFSVLISSTYFILFLCVSLLVFTHKSISNVPDNS